VRLRQGQRVQPRANRTTVNHNVADCRLLFVCCVLVGCGVVSCVLCYCELCGMCVVLLSCVGCVVLL
jgi:hypothetical protein